MRKLIATLITVLIIFNLTRAACFAQEPLRKLGRGLANIATGLVEIPKQVIATSKEKNLATGLTWGWVKGAGLALLRTASGIYEILTFPIPAPAEYEPVISPEFVFEEWN